MSDIGKVNFSSEFVRISEIGPDKKYNREKVPDDKQQKYKQQQKHKNPSEHPSAQKDQAMYELMDTLRESQQQDELNGVNQKRWLRQREHNRQASQEYIDYVEDVQEENAENAQQNKETNESNNKAYQKRIQEISQKHIQKLMKQEIKDKQYLRLENQQQPEEITENRSSKIKDAPLKQAHLRPEVKKLLAQKKKETPPSQEQQANPGNNLLDKALGKIRNRLGTQTATQNSLLDNPFADSEFLNPAKIPKQPEQAVTREATMIHPDLEQVEKSIKRSHSLEDSSQQSRYIPLEMNDIQQFLMKQNLPASYEIAQAIRTLSLQFKDSGMPFLKAAALLVSIGLPLDASTLLSVKAAIDTFEKYQRPSILKKLEMYLREKKHQLLATEKKVLGSEAQAMTKDETMLLNQTYTVPSLKKSEMLKPPPPVTTPQPEELEQSVVSHKPLYHSISQADLKMLQMEGQLTILEQPTPQDTKDLANQVADIMKQYGLTGGKMLLRQILQQAKGDLTTARAIAFMLATEQPLNTQAVINLRHNLAMMTPIQQELPLQDLKVLLKNLSQLDIDTRATLKHFYNPLPEVAKQQMITHLANASTEARKGFVHAHKLLSNWELFRPLTQGFPELFTQAPDMSRLARLLLLLTPMTEQPPPEKQHQIIRSLVAYLSGQKSETTLLQILKSAVFLPDHDPMAHFYPKDLRTQITQQLKQAPNHVETGFMRFHQLFSQEINFWLPQLQAALQHSSTEILPRFAHILPSIEAFLVKSEQATPTDRQSFVRQLIAFLTEGSPLPSQPDSATPSTYLSQPIRQRNMGILIRQFYPHMPEAARTHLNESIQQSSSQIQEGFHALHQLMTPSEQTLALPLQRSPDEVLTRLTPLANLLTEIPPTAISKEIKTSLINYLANGGNAHALTRTLKDILQPVAQSPPETDGVLSDIIQRFYGTANLQPILNPLQESASQEQQGFMKLHQLLAHFNESDIEKILLPVLQAADSEQVHRFAQLNSVLAPLLTHLETMPQKVALPIEQQQALLLAVRTFLQTGQKEGVVQAIRAIFNHNPVSKENILHVQQQLRQFGIQTQDIQLIRHIWQLANGSNERLDAIAVLLHGNLPLVQSNIHIVEQYIHKMPPGERFKSVSKILSFLSDRLIALIDRDLKQPHGQPKSLNHLFSQKGMALDEQAQKVGKQLLENVKGAFSENTLQTMRYLLQSGLPKNVEMLTKLQSTFTHSLNPQQMFQPMQELTGQLLALLGHLPNTQQAAKAIQYTQLIQQFFNQVQQMLSPQMQNIGNTLMAVSGNLRTLEKQFHADLAKAGNELALAMGKSVPKGEGWLSNIENTMNMLAEWIQQTAVSQNASALQKPLVHQLAHMREQLEGLSLFLQQDNQTMEEWLTLQQQQPTVGSHVQQMVIPVFVEGIKYPVEISIREEQENEDNKKGETRTVINLLIQTHTLGPLLFNLSLQHKKLRIRLGVEQPAIQKWLQPRVKILQQKLEHFPWEIEPIACYTIADTEHHQNLIARQMMTRYRRSAIDPL